MGNGQAVPHGIYELSSSSRIRLPIECLDVNAIERHDPAAERSALRCAMRWLDRIRFDQEDHEDISFCGFRPLRPVKRTKQPPALCSGKSSCPSEGIQYDFSLSFGTEAEVYRIPEFVVIKIGERPSRSPMALTNSLR